MHAPSVSYLESVIRFLSRLKPDRLGGKILLGKDLAMRYSVFNEPFYCFCWGNDERIWNEAQGQMSQW